MTLESRRWRWVASICAAGLVLTLCLTPAPAAPPPTITLASWEHVPYVGAGLPSGGYAQQLVRTALERAGYRLRVVMVPAARALHLAKVGAVDGVMPIAPDGANLQDFELSRAFPGDRLGILKRRSTKFSLPAEVVKDDERFWRLLRPYRLGLLRGEYELSGASRVPGMRLELAANDLQNIDKLAHKRVDLLIIDRFTAADLILRHRPHLVGELQFLRPDVEERPFHVGFSRARATSPAVRAAFDAALAQMHKEGLIDRIRATHGLRSLGERKPHDGKLVIAAVNNPDMKLMQDLSPAYERLHPGVKLEWTVLDENTLRTRLLGDVALDDGQYDVMTIGSFEAGTWAQMEWLAPVAPIPASYDLDDLFPAVREQLTTRGSMYALPFYAESSTTFYRTDLFRARGLSMPEHPTYGQIERFAQRLHDPAHGVYGLCLRGQPGWGANMSYVTTLVHTFGGRWFDLQWNAQLDTQPWRQALELYQRLGKFAPPGTTQHNYVENLALFASGKCAMWIDANVAAGQLFDPRFSQVADRTGYADAPVAVTERGSRWLWVWALGISAASKSQDEARRFALWATSKDYVTLVAQHRGWLGVPPGTRKSTYEHAAYRSAAPFAAFVRASIENAIPQQNTLEPAPYEGHYVNILEYPALGDRVGVELSRVLTGERSVREALARSQAIVVEQMRDSGYVER